MCPDHDIVHRLSMGSKGPVLFQKPFVRSLPSRNICNSLIRKNGVNFSVSFVWEREKHQLIFVNKLKQDNDKQLIKCEQAKERKFLACETQFLFMNIDSMIAFVDNYIPLQAAIRRGIGYSFHVNTE